MQQQDSDAFGLLLRDIANGYRYQIIERDDSLIEAGDGTIYLSTSNEWSDRERMAVGLAKGSVLDIGCGAGRHALYLQSRGLDVLGIDNSPGAIALCRERGLSQAEVLPISEVASLASRKFDTILMLGNNLGLLGSWNRGRQLLKALARITTDQAILIGENLDPYQTDNPDHLQYHEWNRAWGRMGGQIRMRVRHRRLIGPWFDYLFLSQSELADLIVGTGWRIAQMMGESQYVAVMEKVR